MGITQISRSLRFNSADSAYLNRTPASAGNRDTWTWSAWVKRSALATNVLFFAGTLGSNDSGIYFGGSNNLDFYTRTSSSLQGYIQTPAVFRDVSAWYHIVAVYDSGNATSADRMILYVNGTRQTVTVNNTLPQNTDSFINSNVAHQIGSYGSDYLNGYLTEINFIDGQALTPSSFGFNSSDTGIWSPKQYIGSYGTNGFYLNFSDNSDTTSTTLGKDYSGNGNNWTPNNFSVAAGAGNDSMVDSPTAYGTDTGVGGEVRGNYATMNPLQYSSTYVNLRNGNLDVSGASGVDAGGAFATAKVNSGKWYWEALILGTQSTYPAIGFAVNTTGAEFQGGARVLTSGTLEIAAPESFITLNGSPSGTSFTTNDVLQFALDMDNGKMWIGKNGTFMNSGVPASGTGNVFSISDRTQFVSPFIFSYNASSVAYNFGQRAFAYTAPSGFKALVTTNLPTPTIGATSTTQANDYFNTVLYTGTGSSLGVTGVGFQPDLVWIKCRSNARNHKLTDAVRGVTKAWSSNDAANGESTDANGLTAFNSDGFTVGTDAIYNTSTNTYVAWNWKANGAGSSNTSGTISSTVSVNTTSSCSIVKYAGNGSSGATVGHGLGVVPNMIIVKRLDINGAASPNSIVYHVSIGNTKGLVLDTTNAAQTLTGFWNDTTPSSTVFTVGNDANTNRNTNNYIAYCFAPVAGYSAFGSYTGNGSTDGPFVYLGFRPEYVMVKRTDTTGAWVIWDSARDTYNVAEKGLLANSSVVEDTTNYIDFLSNGFKLRNTFGSQNGSGATYIYMAFAEFPFKYSLAR
jgi:hypothetical protein